MPLDISLRVFTRSQVINKFLIKLSGKSSTLARPPSMLMTLAPYHHCYIIRSYYSDLITKIIFYLHPLISFCPLSSSRVSTSATEPHEDDKITTALLAPSSYAHLTTPLEPSCWMLLMTIIISSPPPGRRLSFRLCDVINQDFVWWEGKEK
jgi:hypothetical protein